MNLYWIYWTYIARNSAIMDISEVRHNMMHWRTFVELQEHIFELRCDKCGDKQKGLRWVEIGQSGFQAIYDLQCTECGTVLHQAYQTTPRISIDNEGDITQVDKNRYKLFSKDSCSLLGVLLNIICIEHGLQYSLFESMRAILGLPQWSNDSVSHHKKQAAKVVQSVADISVSKAKQQELDYIEHYPDAIVPVTLSDDGAYGNKGGNNAHYAYLYHFNQSINKVTDYDIAEQKDGVSAKKLEGILAKRILPDAIDRLGDVAKDNYKHVDVRLVADKDIAWSTVIEEECIESDDVHVTKVDDINHALKPIFRCVAEAKNSLPDSERKLSGLTVCFAKHLYRSVQFGIYNKPDEYGWEDLKLAVIHYYSGGNHDQCRKDFCPVLNIQDYRPGLGGGTYMDRKNNPIHKKAFDALIKKLREQYTDDQFDRIHGMPRDNVNEALNSVAAKRFGKATRQACREVFRAQIGATAASKNDGKGLYLCNVVSRFGYIDTKHEELLNRIQLNKIYNWHRTRSDEYKKLRAKARKKYKTRELKRKRNKEKYKGVSMDIRYEKDIDNKTGKEPPAKRARVETQNKIKCPYCDKTYGEKNHWYDKHIAKHTAVNVCTIIKTSLFYSESILCYLF